MGPIVCKRCGYGAVGLTYYGKPVATNLVKESDLIQAGETDPVPVTVEYYVHKNSDICNAILRASKKTLQRGLAEIRKREAAVNAPPPPSN